VDFISRFHRGPSPVCIELAVAAPWLAAAADGSGCPFSGVSLGVVFSGFGIEWLEIFISLSRELPLKHHDISARP
jgi:hypothetical protein